MADALYKLVAQQRTLRSSQRMRHIGYTREKTVLPQPRGATETEVAKLREVIDALRRHP